MARAFRSPSTRLQAAITIGFEVPQPGEATTKRGHNQERQGDTHMTTAIRSILLRCCLFLGAIGVALSLSAVGQPATAQQSENLWKDVQERGVLRAGAALAPPHVMRDPKTGEYSGIFVDL